MSIRAIKRNIKFWFQRRIRGWSDDECWNLDYEFIKWVNSRFKKYREQAKIDLSFHKFVFKRKTYTQGELIDKIIYLTDEYIKLTNNSWWEHELALMTLVEEILDIFKILYWAMWW